MFHTTMISKHIDYYDNAIMWYSYNDDDENIIYF